MAVCLAAPSIAAGDDPPVTPANVLVLVADDLGVDMVGAYAEGADLPPTPNLDALAARGVLFRNAYSQPTCSPTRAAALTGRHGFRTGVGEPLFLGDAFGALSVDEWTLPEMLDAGTGGAWEHAALGKWHVSTDVAFGVTSPNDHGFAHFAGSLSNTDAAGGAGYFEWSKIVNGVQGTSTTYATSDTVDEAVAFIGGATEPWFAWTAFHAPHTPLHAPPAALTTIDLSAYPKPGFAQREHYKAMIEALDVEIGRLLASIDPDVLDRTTVVFLGDNGTPSYLTVAPFVPGHGKGTPYEGGTNVPFLVAGPEVDAAGVGGSECAGLVHVVDLLPTLADWAGIDLAATLPGVAHDGLSFAPYLSDPFQRSLRAHVFTEGFAPNYPGATMPTDICQEDLGSGGPGNASISLCGSPLATGFQAQLELTGAPASAPLLIVVGLVEGAQPFKGGQLVVFPPLTAIPLMADPSGGFSLTVPGGPSPGLPPFDLYLQLLVADPSLPKGVALTNALRARLDYPIAIARAVRGERFKLVEVTNATLEFITTYELYDLLADPFEQQDLLTAPLGPEAQLALGELQAALAGILASG